nr:phosphotransferase [Candidatus Saccharicenans sp.]
MSLKNYKKPDLTLREAGAMAAKAFALAPKEIRALPGDRSQNFLIQTESARKYVLKISSSFDHLEELDFENQVILRLSQKLSDYRFPLPQPDVNGQYINIYKRQNEIFYLRLFDYVEGLSLADLESVPLSLWSEIGSLLARIDIVLKDFYHAGSKRELPWDVKNVLWSKDRLKYVTDPVKRRQLDYALLQIETYLLPASRQLRHQVIYGDGNEHNFILEAKKDSYRLAGLIDFGDMSQSFLAAEPAIAL